MHGLVLQEARGEVATVDLVARAVLDSDPAVPGYTFVEVGPLPTALVVPRVTPRCAFVASAGANRVEAIDLRSFRREGASSAERYPPVPLPASPVAMVLAPREDALWVAMPDRSSVARIAVEGCEFGPVEEVGLDLLVPAERVGGGTDLGRYCPPPGPAFQPAPPPRLRPRMPESADRLPRPSALAVGRELLVGDRSLPVIHRIDFDSFAVLEPLATGAVIRDLVATPEVPAALDPNATNRERFIYAIDDADGTVLVVDYSDPDTASFGSILPVGAESSLRPDRIPFVAGARTLEVLLPSYDPGDPFAKWCDPADFPDGPAPGPATLRGVFLAVGLADSTVRFVDVFDLDIPCRGRLEGDAGDCGSSTDGFVYIRRHRPRIGERTTTIGASASEVSAVVNGATTRLTPEGAGMSDPSFDEIECPSGLQPIFATEAQRMAGRARVCGRTDPFEAVAEVWAVAWQAPVFGASGVTGKFRTVSDDSVVLDARVDFCAVGVLSAEAAAEVPSGQPEAGLSGDVLAITTTLPASANTDPTCLAVVGIEGGNQAPRPVLVPIARALSRPDGLREPFRGRLVFDALAPVLDRSTDGLTLADVLRCFGDESIRFEVRARGAFSVAGTRSGQRHRVVRGVGGECVVDPSLPSDWIARAVPGRVFRNAHIAFRIPDAPRAEASELRVVMGNVPSTLSLDLGALGAAAGGSRGLALPSDIVWNDVYQRMYVVDVERRGLVEVSMQPLAYTSSRFE